MDKDLLKIKKLTRFMKNNGVLNLKTPDGIEIEVHPHAVRISSVEQDSPSSRPSEDPVVEPQYTEEEVLFYSTGLSAPVGGTN